VRNRILIVDDSEIVRDTIRIFLSNAGFDVCGEAYDGLNALEKAQELKPDLIVLDIAMPLMDGVHAASLLKAMMPDIFVVFFTIYEESVCGAVASAAGVDVVISKTEGIAKLVRCAHGLLDDSEPAPV
jgi:two-component system, chemotaxis family, chemotaxis protein CheY